MIYFDHNSTTPVRPEVFGAMVPFLSGTGDFGNPSSLHTAGQKARAAVEKAREQTAALLSAEDAGEIVFTSGGTESIQMAVFGAARAHKEKGRHLIASAVEHTAGLSPFRQLEVEEGFSVTYLPVDEYGRVSPSDLEKALRPDTVLVSIMWANNETGTLQNVAALGALCRARRVLFHADAVQAAGKVAIKAGAAPVDMLSLSGHKLYGPKGVGALYVRRGARLAPLFFGGPQEKKRRPGTENVPGIVGLGMACELAGRELEDESRRLAELRDVLARGLLSRVPGARLNGSPDERLPNTVNLSFEGVEGEALVLSLDQAAFALKKDVPGVAASTGSACASGLHEPSHVLKAMGLSASLVRGAVRFSLGLSNTRTEVEQVLEIVPLLVDKLRAASPHWQDLENQNPSPLGRGRSGGAGEGQGF